MSIITKTKGLVAGVLGLTLAFSLFVGVGVKSSGAQALTAAQLIDLLISLGIIAPDKAAAARSAVGGTSSTPSTSMGSGYNFTRDLQVGSVGDDVKALQQWLNANGYTVAASGVGSKGMESTTFGPATRAALIKFQIAKGITPAAGYFGPKTMAFIKGGSTTSSNNGGTTVVVPTGSEVMVSLASDTPANVALVSGQAIGDLAHFTLKNNSSSEARITSLVLNRTGVSNDSTINNVYVYEGGKRLTDSAVVSSGKISFNEPAGILVIPAGYTKTISIRADIAGSTAGQILGVSLVTVGANVPVLGSFPISGNPLSIASATMATVDFNNSTTPSTATVEPQDGYTIWQNTVSVSTRAVDLKSISFRQTGSIQTSDVRNFKLFVDGVQVGSTVAAIDSNNYITFDLPSAIRLQTGGRVIKVVADIVGGSTKTFTFQLRQPSDAMMIDSELMQPVLATANGSTFSARSTGTVTVQGGSLSVTRSNTSPTDNVSVDASNVKVATFEFRAAGENVKIENLDVRADATVSNGGLDNGKVFVNGVQVGSTKDLTDATDVNFTFGSSFIVNAGTVAIVDIYADIKTTTGASYSNGSTFTVSIGANSSNAQGMTSLNTISVPSSQVDANALTVNSASVTVSKNSGFGDQTIVAGTTGAKLGSFSISAGSTEGIDVNTLTINLSSDEAASVTNLTLKDDATGNVLGTVKTTPSTANSFSVNLPIAKSSTKVISVYADVKTNSDAGAWNGTVEVNGNGQTTGNSASTSSAVTLQTITLGSGSLTLAISANNPDSNNVVAGSLVKVGQFTFKAVNSGFTVNELKVKVPNGAASSTNGITLKFKDKAGATQTVSQVLVTGTEAYATATFTGLTMYVTKDSTVGSDVEVWTTVNSLQSNNGQSGAAISASIDYNEGFKATPDGGSVITSVGSADIASNTSAGKGTLYGRVSVPQITKVSAGLSTPVTGQAIYKFSIKADANGPVEFKKISFSVATSGVTVSDFYLRRSGQSSDINTSAAQATAAGVVSIYAGTANNTTVEQIGAGETRTYELRGTVLGWGDTSDSLVISFTEDSSAVANNSFDNLSSSANMIWSDVSAVSHATGTTDWTNGYLIKDLATDVQSFTPNSSN